MIYSADLLLAFYVLLAGLSTSWIATRLTRHPGRRMPVHAGGRFFAFGARDWAAAMAAGPLLLIANGYAQWREGEVSAGLFAMVAFVALGWSALLGIVVLQLAFASDLFRT